MERISKSILENKIIIEVNYANLRETQIIGLLNDFISVIRSEHKPCNVIKYLNDKVFVTPAVYTFGKKILKENIEAIDKLCFVGLTSTHEMLLKGFNIFVQRNFRNFSTRQEALNFILDSTSNVYDLPDYYKNYKV